MNTSYNPAEDGIKAARQDALREVQFEQVEAILIATHDGDDLSELDLWIVQEAVNNHLNAKGWEKFEEIYQERVEPLRIPYEEQDEILHTEAYPFCSDWECPCHTLEAINAVTSLLMEGLLSWFEVKLILTGRTV